MLTAAALLGSAAIASASQYAMNQANLKNAANLNDSSIALANTQHQREVADLRLAGLNPILSANGSGAAVPTLNQVDQKSLAESIPGTAKELARYASDQYKLSNDLTRAEVRASQLENYASAAEADERHSAAEVQSMENAARLQALHADNFVQVGNDVPYDSPTFWRLVEQYRNEINSGAYKSSLGHAVYEDTLNGVNSAAGVMRSLPRSSRPVPRNSNRRNSR